MPYNILGDVESRNDRGLHREDNTRIKFTYMRKTQCAAAIPEAIIGVAVIKPIAHTIRPMETGDVVSIGISVKYSVECTSAHPHEEHTTKYYFYNSLYSDLVVMPTWTTAKHLLF